MWKTFFLANLKEGPIKVGLGRLLSSRVEKLWKTFIKKFPNKKIMGWVGHYHRHFGFGIPKKKAGVENFFYPHPVLKTCL
jgi:hypothetical protein